MRCRPRLGTTDPLRKRTLGRRRTGSCPPQRHRTSPGPAASASARHSRSDRCPAARGSGAPAGGGGRAGGREGIFFCQRRRDHQRTRHGAAAARSSRPADVGESAAAMRARARNTICMRRERDVMRAKREKSTRQPHAAALSKARPETRSSRAVAPGRARLRASAGEEEAGAAERDVGASPPVAAHAARQPPRRPRRSRLPLRRMRRRTAPRARTSPAPAGLVAGGPSPSLSLAPHEPAGRSQRACQLQRRTPRQPRQLQPCGGGGGSRERAREAGAQFRPPEPPTSSSLAAAPRAQVESV